MLRPALAGLATLSLGAFSCDLGALLGSGPAASASAEAPAAPPPGVVAAAPPAALAPSAPAPRVDPLVTAIAEHLGERDTGMSPAEAARVARALVGESRARELEPLLVLAVAEVESGCDAFAISPAGAVGLMQILPATGEALAERLEIPWNGARTLFDPVANLKLGVAYLDELLARYGDLPTALAAYNWGPSRIDRRLRRGGGLPVSYSRRVLESYRENDALRGT